jgi:tetratricopeptide (TPR) repeat protein
MSTVSARIEALSLPSYPVGAPEKNPVFFEKRVYQGSNGKVYPVPFIDKVYDEPKPVSYRSATLENEYVKLVMLPELGGRILIGQDKSNNNYDFFYRQDVIKPALVGLAGPWISGGVEFNWPQHHRPGTFMPADMFIEDEADGAKTVWFSEHDPLFRLKGMHGLRLRSGSSLIELRARLFNRTPFTHSFLWWANVAARVHDRYQSFFPSDVRYVADHAVRAMSSFPEANTSYYGVKYQDRPGANDLSWYRNIPVPTSYMVCETAFDFFGGYDYEAQGGFVHVADRHISPGKKQWTWGKHPFGQAWDRELTDQGGPYIELMAGVYTDNQPDFSYLLPYETKTFSQFWWPIQKLGPVQNACKEAALRLVVDDKGLVEIGVLVSKPLPAARLVLMDKDRVLLSVIADLQPGEPFARTGINANSAEPSDLFLLLDSRDGRRVLSYRPPLQKGEAPRHRSLAKEPPAPVELSSQDQLYLVGEHLELYRHPTRNPEDYWDEALRRDPGDARCNLALGRRLLKRGEFETARNRLLTGIGRLTSLHPNPVTGEAHYYLGLCLRFLAERKPEDATLLEDAYSAFFKSTWNYEWRGAAYFQLACIDSLRGDAELALQHLDDALATNRDHNAARCLRAALLRRTNRREEAKKEIAALLSVDPLDQWARAEESLLTGSNESFFRYSRNDAQIILDLAFDQAWAGLHEEAAKLLSLHQAQPVQDSAVPNPLSRTAMTRYAEAWILYRAGKPDEARDTLKKAAAQSPDYFFPSRLNEQLVLEWALSLDAGDPVAAFGLGNMFYDRRRHEEAIRIWEKGLPRAGSHATLHRNLGIATWNVRRDGTRARHAYERALAIDPRDARLVYESDQLAKKLNLPLRERLAFLEARRDLVLQRDDASVEFASLYNLLHRPQEALELLLSRRFHPWEGGEGSVLRQYSTARLLLGYEALQRGDATEAVTQFTLAMDTPESLGEAYHLHQAKADVNTALGLAHKAVGNLDAARRYFEASAAECGDFSEMAVAEHSPLSYHRGLALRYLGRTEEAERLFRELRDYGRARIGRPAVIDYFATSLPNLLVFEEDLQARRDAENHLLAALGCAGCGDRKGAEQHLASVFAFTLCDQRAVDLQRQLPLIKFTP